MKIAITGGIGSGKSTVADIIAKCGYKVLSCDKIYDDLLADNYFTEALTAEFGNVTDNKGKIDRKKLAAIVFSEKQKLNKLNSITHSVIINTALSQMDSIGLNFCEVPLLFENGYEKKFDAVIVVLRNEQKRIISVSNRDGIDVKNVKDRINNQFSYKNYNFEEYYVIHNDSDFAKLNEKTLEILNKLEFQFNSKKL